MKELPALYSYRKGSFLVSNDHESHKDRENIVLPIQRHNMSSPNVAQRAKQLNTSLSC